MEHALTYARVFSRLVRLLRLPHSTRDEVRETLRLVAAHARERTLVVALVPPDVLLGDTPVADSAGLEALVVQLHAHGVRRLAVRQFASAAELLKLARLLAEPPQGGCPTDRRAAALRLWSVTLATAGDDAGAAAGHLDNAPDLEATAGHLAQVESATLALDAASPLRALVALAERCAAEGRADVVAAVLAGLVDAERGTRSSGVREGCGRAIDRLARLPLACQVARRLPALAGDEGAYAAHLVVVGRCGPAGAAALVAHLMAADAIEERRVYYEAIVRLRAGVPLLLDALAHGQWYVARNAACLLGEMRVERAQRSLARLLEHPDARVREAAAGALARIGTGEAYAALRRVLHDPSPAVRQHAARAFAEGAPARVPPPLAAALDAEPDGDVQLSIIAALGRLGTPDAVEKLARAARGRPSGRPASCRVAALEALAAAAGEAVLPILDTLRDDPERAVREAVARLAAAVAPAPVTAPVVAVMAAPVAAPVAAPLATPGAAPALSAP